MTVYLGCFECEYPSGSHYVHCSQFVPTPPRPTTQARSQASTRERSDVLNDVAELIERCDRVEKANHILQAHAIDDCKEITSLREENVRLKMGIEKWEINGAARAKTQGELIVWASNLVRTLEEIKALCVKERTR